MSKPRKYPKTLAVFNVRIDKKIMSDFKSLCGSQCMMLTEATEKMMSEYVRKYAPQAGKKLAALGARPEADSELTTNNV